MFWKKSSKIFTVSNGNNIAPPTPEKKQKTDSTQSSFITIFSIWNTTMGTSLLAMAWGIQMAGVIPGTITVILLGGFCLYTAYCCIQVSRDHGGELKPVELPTLCRTLIGKWAQHFAEKLNIIVLLGICVVFWILMSNFFYYSVQFIINKIQNTNDSKSIITGPANVICQKSDYWKNSSEIIDLNATNVYDSSITGDIWNLYSTVPVFLAILLFPILNSSNITFFTKFNSLGTISVFYILSFVITKSTIWGINLNLNEEPFIKNTFTALTGMLSLSFNIHNVILSIIKKNRNQKKNGRDLSIAYVLVIASYLILGVLFYSSFPLAKSCIEDNILNNFEKNDPMTLFARILLLFQISTIFPLALYMLRINVFSLFVKENKAQDVEVDYTEIKFPQKWIILFNLVIVTICILVACFLPNIGLLIRYIGALSGFVYVFTLPSLLKIASLKKRAKLTKFKLILFICIPILGACNLFSQFFI